MNLNLLNISNSQLYILTFIVTALWDVVLRFLALNWESLPPTIKFIFPFIKYLIPYFQKHTLLAAALIAGFVGATTQPLILSIIKFPNNLNDIKYVSRFLLISFLISAFYGFIMKFSKLFPILEQTYYKNLEKDHGVFRSMYHDGISGLIVQITLFFILLILS